MRLPYQNHTQLQSVSARPFCPSQILIDRCNFDVQQRSHWLTLPRADVLRRTAVFLDVPTEVALERVLSRKSHEGQ
eukprot:6196379-Pleurochrysis_carterae.AAC.1